MIHCNVGLCSFGDVLSFFWWRSGEDKCNATFFAKLFLYWVFKLHGTFPSHSSLISSSIHSMAHMHCKPLTWAKQTLVTIVTTANTTLYVHFQHRTYQSANHFLHPSRSTSPHLTFPSWWGEMGSAVSKFIWDSTHLHWWLQALRFWIIPRD